MIVYEVNLQVDSIAADEYAEWLEPHIEQRRTGNVNLRSIGQFS